MKYIQYYKDSVVSPSDLNVFVFIFLFISFIKVRRWNMNKFTGILAQVIIRDSEVQYQTF